MTTTSKLGADMTDSQWILDVMGRHDFTMPQKAFDEIVRKLSARQRAAIGKQEPVATLHDDGRYTWRGAKSHGFSYAGWRMEVYAAPLDKEAKPAAPAQSNNDTRAAVEFYEANPSAALMDFQKRFAAAPSVEQDERGADTGNPEADRIIGRLSSSDPDFDDCIDAVAFIRKLVAEHKGPDGFATWKDAAIAERMETCKCKRLGDWKGFHHPLCDEAPPAQTAITDAAPLVKLFDVLMRQNIETSEESYLSLKCVGVPPTDQEFVRSVQRTLDAAQSASGDTK